MADTKIQRYEVQESYPEEVFRVVKHPQGDYVEFYDHQQNVTELQQELDAAKEAISKAVSLLNEI